MKKLSPFTTHNLIRKEIPEARTVWSKREKESQMTFEEYEWAMNEKQLMEQDPVVYYELLNNIFISQRRKR